MSDISTTLPLEAIQVFCAEQPIVRLSLFGSALHGTMTSDSDIDLLVEFDPVARLSLFDVGGMQMDLSEILGRMVDIKTADELHPRFREQVVNEALVLYERQ